MSHQQAPVIIDGIKVVNTSRGWQIARTIKNSNGKRVVILRKTPEETFKVFVSKCEEKGINYKTDFDSLDLPKAQRNFSQYGITREDGKFKRQVVNIEGFNATNTTGEYWQIARWTTNTSTQVVVKGKTPEETFLKFVAKCEEKGVNYKTDFRTLGVTNQKVDTVVTQELTPVINKESVLSQDVIINETYGFSLKLKGATPETLRRVNYHLVSLFKDQALINKLKDGSIFNEELTLRSSEAYCNAICSDDVTHGELSAFGDYISDLICETFDVWFKGDYPENFKQLMISVGEYYSKERTSLRMR